MSDILPGGKAEPKAEDPDGDQEVDICDQLPSNIESSGVESTNPI